MDCFDIYDTFYSYSLCKLVMKFFFIPIFIIVFSYSKFSMAEGALKYTELATQSASIGDYRQAIKYLNIAMGKRWNFEPKTTCINNNNKETCIDLPGSPNFGKSYYINLRAKLYLRLEDYNSAINDFIFLDDFYEVGLVYDKVGHYDEAKEWFVKAYNENECRDPQKKFKKYNLKVGFFDCMFKD